MKKAILGVAVLLLARLAPSTPTPHAQEVVVWTELRGALAAEGALDSTSPAGREAGGVSTRSLHSGDGQVEFGVASPSGGVVCGLTRHGHDVGYEEIDFAFLLEPEGRLSVVESGQVRGPKRSYSPSDRFRVAVEKGVVVYRQNGELLVASNAPVHYPLRVQASLTAPGAGLRDVVLAGALVENVEWVGSEETRTYANDVLKVRGAEGGSAVALSAQALNGDGLVEWRVDDAALGAALGFVSVDSASPEGDPGAFDHALLARGSTLFVVEGGAPAEVVGKVQAGDRLGVAVQGEAVEYRVNGRLVQTSALRAHRPLRIKAEMEDLGAAVDGVVVSGSTTRVVGRPPVISVPSGHYEEPQSVAVVPLDPGAAVTYTMNGPQPAEADSALRPEETLLVVEDTVLRARAWPVGRVAGSARSSTLTLGFTTSEEVVWSDARKGQAVSTREITSVDGYIETSVGEPATEGMIGLSGATSGGTARIDYALELSGSRLFVNERGRRRAAVGQGQAGDRLRVAIQGGLIKYRSNGRLLFTSHAEPALPLVGRAVLRAPGGTFARTVLSGRLQDSSVPEAAELPAPERAAAALLFELPAPVLSPAPGLYADRVTVSISAEPGATIRYTTDGITEPSEAASSPIYSTPLVLIATTTLKTKAFHPGWSPSPTTTGTYSIKVATPVVSPAGGTYSGVRSVRLASTTPGAVIHYTFNGGDPTEGDPGVGSTGTVLLAVTGTLRAKGFKNGLTASDTAAADFVFPRLGAAAGSYFHSLVLKPDGTVWAFGYNGNGMLGDGTLTQRTTPVQSVGVSNAVAIAAGSYHSLALKADGHVLAWGNNQYGQLGDGTNTRRPSSVEVASAPGVPLTDVVAIAAGQDHSLALKSDGSVWAWGYNSLGQLGDGTTTDRTRPTVVAQMQGAIAIGAGAWHSLAVKGDGSGWGWGRGGQGQLGDGTTTAMRLTPTAIVGITGAMALRGGLTFSLALGVDGLAFGWGYNDKGQLGDDTYLQRTTPVRVVGLAAPGEVAAGLSYSLARANGEAWAWGDNYYGQLGDGATTMRKRPARVPTLSSLVAVGSGANHALAIDAGGSVWAWGYNYYGQLGDGTTGDGTNPYRSSPVSVSGPGFAWRVGTPVMSVAPGTYSAPFAVTLTGATAGASIYYSTNGGDPATPYTGPVSIGTTTLLKARAVKGGQTDSNVSSALYTLKPAAPAFSPGGGAYGSSQTVTISCAPTPSCATLGLTLLYSTNGSEPSTAYASPLLIGTTTTLKAKAVKANWSDSDTTSATYTLNRGTLAAPTLTPTAGTYLGSQAVQMSSISGAAIRYTLDGTTDPTVTSPAYSSPITLTATTTVKAKAFHPDWTASPTATVTYTIKVASPPTISLPSGQYPIGQELTVTSSDPGATILYALDGSAPTTTSPSVPSGTTLRLVKALTLKAVASRTGCLLSDVATAGYTVTGAAPIVTVAGGDLHSLITKPDGRVWAWGDNGYGQVGDTTQSQRLTPVLLASPSGVATVDGGSSQSVGLTSAGRVWVWGANSYGQLGDGTTTLRPTPVLLASPTGVVASSTGASHTLAVKSDGTAWAWGYNYYGQLGIGSTTPTQSASPVQIPSLGNAVSAAAGTAHSLAVKSDGTVWAWGSNNYGVLGDGSTTQRTAPVQVSGLTGAAAVAAGHLHSLARKSDGSVWAWGYGSVGQLGDGTWSNRSTPVRVAGLTGAVAIAAGSYHSLAILSDGTIWAWGQNSTGALGDGTITNRPAPVRIPIPGAVIAVGAGANHSLAVTLDGTVWAWGYNNYGQAGIGTKVSPLLTPTRVSDGSYAWRVGVPTFDVPPGTYYTDTTVRLSSVTPGATICYTLDGTDPSGCQSSVPSGGTVTVAASLTLRAKGYKAGMPASEEGQAAYTLVPLAPTLSPGPTTHYTDVTVTMTAAAGATIRYTTDGSNPTPTTGTVYSAPVAVTRTQTLIAKAFKPGWADSYWTAGGVYTMKVATTPLTPVGGSFGAPQTVVLSTTTPGATIRYTTNGREPAPTDTAGSSVMVDRSLTVKAKAFRDGWTTSDTASAAYFLMLGAAAVPTMDPSGGSYATPQLVVLRSATAGARLRYTLDGSEPTLSSSPYLAPILIDATATVKAKAFAGDVAPSSTAVATYTIAAAQVAAPRFTPASGVFATARSVTVTCATAGAVVRYTTNGADPTPSDPTIASGQSINVDRATTLKAKAWLGSTPSAVREGSYHITGAVAAGGVFGSGIGHSLALRADGHVWSWGTNNSGQLGDGTTSGRTAPVEVKASAGVPLSAVVAVEAGYGHSLAIKTDGHVWAWGYNCCGQLGSGSTTSTPVVFPVEVKRQSGQALDGIVGLAAGQYHSLAVKSDGTVWAWGYNQYGVLGDGTVDFAYKPYAASVLRASDGQPLDGVVAVATSHAHCLALRSDGTVWGWGYGQGVDGSTSSLSRAVQVSGLNGFVGVAAGPNFSATVRVDGTVWAWGANAVGQLGHGSTTATVRPLPAANLTRAVRVDVGPYGQHVVALVHGGAGEQTAWAWGSASYSQMGDSSTGTRVDRLSPAQVPRMVDVVAISAGGSHTMAILGDGTVWTWGDHMGGALGRDGAYPLLPSTPSPVPGFTLADTSWVTADPDGDGLPTGFEWRLGTDALKADTNGDGLPDGAAVNNGVSTTDPDTDGDGVRNVVEVARGTDPLRSDTDSDGVGDGQDCFPLDSSRWQCAQPVPGDTTPPSILLNEPTNAILVSSLP